MYSDRQVGANSVDPDEAPQNAMFQSYGSTLFATHPAVLKHNIG